MDIRWIYNKMDLLKSKPLREKDKREIDRDRIEEIWGGRGSYLSYFKGHVNSIGINQLVDDFKRSVLKDTLSDLKNNRVAWAAINPATRAAMIAKLAMDFSEGIAGQGKGPSEADKDAVDDEGKPVDAPHLRHKKIQKRKHERPPTGIRPRPNARKDPNPPDDDPKRPRLKSPRPLFHASPQPIPVRPEKPNFESRVGYFVSLSDLGFYSEEPAIYPDPTVEMSFEGEADGYLALGEGETWRSSWYEGPVIRGINVDMNGIHRLKYSRNGDFEE